MSDEKEPKRISRREFVKGAAIGAAAVAGAGVLASCGPEPTPCPTAAPCPTAVPCPPAPTAVPCPTCAPTGVPDKWDYEADVVVLGSGTVFPAAIVPAKAGLKVLVLEKAKAMGGTTITSGGGLSIPNNYLMKADGVEDSKAKAFEYIKAAAEGQSNDEVINAWIDNGNEMLEWLRDNAGFQWERAKGNQGVSDYYTYPGTVGGERRWVSSVAKNSKMYGAGLFEYVKEAFDKFGVDVMYETPGKRLVYSGHSNLGDGEVIGVIAESGGKEIAIKAKRGVVIGTGGFEHNAEMRLAYLRTPISAANTVPTNTGDGHLMGMAVGADLRNMNECYGVPFFKPDPNAFGGVADWYMYRGRPGSVLVNKHGERIGNEATGYDAMIRAFSAYDNGVFEWRNIPSFMIYDSGYTARYLWPGSYMPGGDMPAWMTKADTLKELAEKLGIDAAGLAATMEQFNKNAADGVDPVYHRGEAPFDVYTCGDLKRTELKNPCLAPLNTPPFYGAAYYPGTCGTNGGLRVNGKAQVLNVWGKPIPRLYCTSCTMANPAGGSYPTGGTPLGTGTTFGYIAGKEVSALASWES